MYEPNVNIKNPVEINLLYVQARDCILDGTHPCTVDEACQVWFFRRRHAFFRVHACSFSVKYLGVNCCTVFSYS